MHKWVLNYLNKDYLKTKEIQHWDSFIWFYQVKLPIIINAKLNIHVCMCLILHICASVSMYFKNLLEIVSKRYVYIDGKLFLNCLSALFRNRHLPWTTWRLGMQVHLSREPEIICSLGINKLKLHVYITMHLLRWMGAESFQYCASEDCW